MLAEHTRRDLLQIREDVERDHVLTAEQALEFGLIDHVISPRSIVRAS